MLAVAGWRLPASRQLEDLFVVLFVRRVVGQMVVGGPHSSAGPTKSC